MCVSTACSATGLYYLAELIEEYTVRAKKIVRIMVWVSECVGGGVLSSPIITRARRMLLLAGSV